MNNLQEINEIINNSVQNSSYTTVIISSCVFILYTLIVRLVDYFKAKSKNKPLLDMAAAIKENTLNIVKLNSVLDKTLKDAERKEIKQCDSAIQSSFRSFAFVIAQKTAAIIVHNNIANNKKLIEENIRKIVSTEYYRLYSALAIYEINEINVASKLREEWIKEVSDSIITIVYDGQEAIFRITHINDKLAIFINEYSTYINNKIFNT